MEEIKMEVDLERSKNAQNQRKKLISNQREKTPEQMHLRDQRGLTSLKC